MYTKIRSLCKEKKISVRELEHEAGVGSNTISKWDVVSPSVDKVKRVADRLGVTVDELLK